MFFIKIILESCPPISIIVLTSGYFDIVPIAWAVISFFMMFAPRIVPISFLADHVVPITTNRYSEGIFGFKFSRTSFTAFKGFPLVHKYELAKIVFFYLLLFL